MLEYKGYTGHAELDDEAGVFHGEVEGIRDVVTFEGRTVDELRQAFRDSVDDYLAMCAERGEQADKPYSGKFVVRIDPALHRDVALAASRDRKSLNAWVADVFSICVNRAPAGRSAVYEANPTSKKKSPPPRKRRKSSSAKKTR